MLSEKVIIKRLQRFDLFGTPQNRERLKRTEGSDEVRAPYRSSNTSAGRAMAPSNQSSPPVADTRPSSRNTLSQAYSAEWINGLADHFLCGRNAIIYPFRPDLEVLNRQTPDRPHAKHPVASADTPVDPRFDHPRLSTRQVLSRDRLFRITCLFCLL